MNWMNELTEREAKEVAFAVMYFNQFNHGTTGHNQLVLIAKLAEMLNRGYGMHGAVRLPDPPKQGG